MALFSTLPFESSILHSTSGDPGRDVHIFEPEFHQDIYTEPEARATRCPFGYFRLSGNVLVEPAHRGIQPTYVDDIDDPSSLIYQGMTRNSGEVFTEKDTTNVAAIKSVGVREGYIQLESSRAVSGEFYHKKKSRAGIFKNDLLINSTGDGTIGRVAVYHYDFPAIVDGHITIARFQNPDLAWYTAAYLLSETGQRQIYRYINGSSGQVEIYPSDIARLAIPLLPHEDLQRIAFEFRDACSMYTQFRTNLNRIISTV